jgi:hypothetical protein
MEVIMMHKKIVHKKGFSLIAFVFYLLFFSLIIFCVCHCIVFIIIPVMHTTRSYNQRVECHLGTDVFVRDVRQCNYPFEIKKFTLHEIIWGNKKMDIGWRYNDHKLERIEGIYKNEKWVKKTTSIVASHLNNAFFEADMHNGDMVGITLHLVSAYKQAHRAEKALKIYVATKR